MTFDAWKKDCRVQKDSLEDIEKRTLPADDGRVPHVPFGFQNEKWLKFKNQIQEGDEIYYFGTSPESWRNLAGREGFVLVRGNEVIDTFVTMMN